MNKVPFYGLNVVCGDDPGVRALLPRVKRPVLTYGFAADNQLRAVLLESGMTSRFEVWRDDRKLGEVSLPHPGRHNILNALAAIGAATAADIPFERCVEGLATFRGVGRRFEFKGERNGVTVIDDYGHHPAEIAATLATARQVFPNRRLVVAFQPHRYTRTRDLFEDFVKVLSSVDVLLLAEVYPAGEQPIVAADGRTLARTIRVAGKVDPVFVADIADMPAVILNVVEEGDVVMTMGAGSISGVPGKLVEKVQI